MNVYKLTDTERVEATMSCLAQYQRDTHDVSLDLDKVKVRFLADVRIAKEKLDKQVADQVRQLKNPDEIKTQLITISIDKEQTAEDAVLQQKAVIAGIKKANYKWIVNASYSFEYYSSNGWNPHIHIKIDKTCRDSQIAQQVRRKAFKGVYRVDVSSKNDQIHTAYLMGDKKEAKRENVEQDALFRKQHNLLDYYSL